MAATDARPVPKKNVAYRLTFPIYDADGDLVTGAASLDSEVSLDGGAMADCTNEASEISGSGGVYFIDLTAAEMNADTVAFICKTGTAGAKTSPIILNPEEAGDIRVELTSGVALIWDYLLTAILTAGSIGKLIKDFLDAAISSRMATFTYTAPDNATVALIHAKTTNLPSDPADASDIAASHASLNTQILTRLATAGYTAPDNATVALIHAKTQNLPVDTATDLATMQSTIIARTIVAANYALEASLQLVKAKTDNLPGDPADASVLAGLIATAQSTLTKLEGLIEDSGGNRFTTKALEQAPSGGGGGGGDVNVETINGIDPETFIHDNTLLAIQTYDPPTRGEATSDKNEILDAMDSGDIGGSGSVQSTITVNAPETDDPVSGAEVWVSTDSAGNNIVAGTLTTNDFGQVTFMLDPGTYYVWVDHSDINFTNPTTHVVS